MSAGFIYRLSCDNLCYYGSSRKVEKRIKKHKNDYNDYKKHGGNKCTSVLLYELAEQKGLQVESDILERFEDISDEDLAKREDYYIVNYECVNENRAFTTDEEKKEKNKEFREKNRDLFKQYQRNYVEKNKELVYQQQRKYIEKNREQINQRNRERRENNREKYNKQMRERYEKNKDKINKQARERRAKRKLIEASAPTIITELSQSS